MKAILRILFTGFCSILILSPTAYSQGNTHNFDEGGLIIWYPSNWKITEHQLHFLMPNTEELSVQLEIVEAPDFDAAVKISTIELKAMFPNDMSSDITETVVNGMQVRGMQKSSEKRRAKYFVLQSPSGKYVKIYCIAAKDILTKYEADIDKIIENLKPL
ncbi:MAG: hypothetical protein K1X85_11490 [Ignavibacteria bacterium]|nr:hypothetical protein [Ignavibacteria bacterium]